MALQDGGYFVALLLAAWAIVRTVRNRKRMPLPMAETSATTASAGWYPDGDRDGQAGATGMAAAGLITSQSRIGRR